MDFLSSAGRAFKKAISSTASKLTGVGYVVAVKMPSDVINVITNRVQSEETSDAEELNFTLERLGVLSGGNQRNAAGKLCFYIQLPDPSRSDFDEFQAPGLLAPTKDFADGCILADDGKVIGRQSQYSSNLWAPDYQLQPHSQSPQLPRTSSVPKFQTQSPNSYRLETRSVGSRMETQSIQHKLNILGQNQETSLLALIEPTPSQRPESSSRSVSEYRPKKKSSSTQNFAPNVFYAPAGSIIEPRISKIAKAMTEVDDGEGHSTNIHRRFHQNQKKKRKQLKKFKRRQMEEGLLMLSVLFRRRKRKVLRAIFDYSRSLKLRNKQVDLRVKLAINGIKSVLHRKIQKINFQLLQKLRKMAEMAESIKRETSVAVIREASSGEEEEDLRQKHHIRVPSLKLAQLIQPVSCAKIQHTSQRTSGYEPSPYMTPTLRSDRQSTRRINIDTSSQSSAPTALENAAVFRPNMDQLSSCTKLRDAFSKRFTKWALHFWLRLRDRQLRSVFSESKGMWRSSSHKAGHGLTSYKLQPLRMGNYAHQGPQSELSPDMMRSKQDLARYVEERRRIVFRKQYSEYGYRQPHTEHDFMEGGNESTQIYTPLRQSPQRQLSRCLPGGLLPTLPFGQEISESQNQEEFKQRLSSNRYSMRLPRKKFDSEFEEDTQQEEYRVPFRRKQKHGRIFELSDEISSIMQRSHSLSRSTNIASLPHLLMPFANNPGEFDQEAYKELFADELESKRITPMTEEVRKEEEIQEQTERDQELEDKMEQDIQHFSQILNNGKSIFEEIKDIVQQNQMVANKYKDLIIKQGNETPLVSGRSEASSQESLKIQCSPLN